MTRTEYRIVERDGSVYHVLAPGPDRLEAIDERNPDGAPHRCEQRVVTFGPWLPVSG